MRVPEVATGPSSLPDAPPRFKVPCVKVTAPVKVLFPVNDTQPPPVAPIERAVEPEITPEYVNVPEDEVLSWAPPAGTDQAPLNVEEDAFPESVSCPELSAEATVTAPV